ncbi:UvrD-helicase domain-containing protein [Candidatus Contendibacter odensensis]|uniref:UvrD-like helicase ATP-binding domain-containing protein n=1 Tax=Candidatus Contendobacter odensis Run_B_J11 TaxID=1400861 RepID=A0A7U7G8B6_9GAMM|nr:UvrD-helicase domain-containing protein [Candidatus Contendobacter odensis]CDH43786.1 hypothetical protein BN874_1320004 [Candidatus Contendobacter odensis Run_B_J11]
MGCTPNAAQKRDVIHVDDPLYLPAGPGSGKTRVLLWRTVNLIIVHGVRLDEIFLSTFTEKAALSIPCLGFSNARIGGHSARSMMFLEMRSLVNEMPLSVKKDDFARVIVEENALEKPTLSSRKKSLRHLTELYGLDPSKALFRVLWTLGHDDLEALPQLCLVSAYARDPQLRHSFELIRTLRLGETLERSAMERHLENGFPDRFSPAMKKSMAQNVNTSWTVGEHLTGKAKKVRRFPDPRPLSAAYALFVGYLTGLRGERLLNSIFADLVAANRPSLQAALSLAAARGLLSLKQAADIVEFDFSSLLTPEEQAYLHESD